jgi:hypothetical protein
MPAVTANFFDHAIQRHQKEMAWKRACSLE